MSTQIPRTGWGGRPSRMRQVGQTISLLIFFWDMEQSPKRRRKRGRTALRWQKYAYERHSLTPSLSYHSYSYDMEDDYDSQISDAMWQIGEILKKCEGVDPNPKDSDGLEPEDPSLHEKKGNSYCTYRIYR